MADIAELIVVLKLRDGVSSGLGNLNSQLKGMQGGLSQIGKGIGQVGAGLSTMATRGAIAAAGLGTAFITTAASMEEAFVGVQKTVDETADVSFEELRQQLRKMSSDTGTAFEELARIGETGGALGVGIESLDEFIDVVNRLGVSTDLSTDMAATALGQLGTTLHLTGSEFESFADTLVALGNAGASTEPAIVDLATRFAAAGNRAGLTSDEILALSSAVASMGVEVEAGGTALSQTFNNIALAIGTGGKEVEAFTNLLGINAAEFRRRWETDALGTFQEFLAVISQLPPIEQAVALEAAGITGQRQLSAIGLMADNYGFVAEQLEVARSATGALGVESDKFFGTSAAGFRKVKENVRLAADTIGTQLLPIVNELGGEFVTSLQDPKTQQGIKEFGTNLASGIREFVVEIKKADFGPLIDTMKGAAAIAKTAFDAFRSLPAPLQQLALAAIVANKVTGGAVGQIAGGLGNIVKGLIQIRFGRGETPMRPMYVQNVGPGGGLGGGPGGGPSSGWGKALGVLIGAGVAFELGQWLSLNGPDFFPAAAKNAPVKFDKGGGGLVDPLTASLAPKIDKLATTEVIEHLARTTEVGLKDVGTTFQTGITTGLDPIGDYAAAILARAENPLDPPVMAEINGHIAGLEEIQATYLANGDVTLAGKVQTNIDKLHELIGTTDTTRTEIVSALAKEATRQISTLLGIGAADAARIQGLRDSHNAANAQLATANTRLGNIEHKDWRPQIYLTNSVSISATLLEQKLIQAKVAAVGLSSATGAQITIQ